MVFRNYYSYLSAFVSDLARYVIDISRYHGSELPEFRVLFISLHEGRSAELLAPILDGR